MCNAAGKEGAMMTKRRKARLVGCVGVGLLALAAAGLVEAATSTYSGTVVSLDQAAGTIVVGDMGPLLQNGKSEIVERRIQVTRSTKFVRLKRAAGAAPSGWIGDYVETTLPAWDVKPGDWVTITGERGPQRMTAVKVTVVDTSQP